MQFTTDPAFGEIEDAYRAYLEAWGTWMVRHHAGARGEADEHLARVLIAARSNLSEHLRGLGSHALGVDDAAALQTLRSCLPDLDGWAAPLDGRAFNDSTEPADAASRQEMDSLTTLRRTTFEAWGKAMANLDVLGERLDRLTVMARLAREPDETRRRALFLSMGPAWLSLNGDDGPSSPYRQLLAASAARWVREGSPIDRNAAALGIEPASVEPTLRRVLATYRRLALGESLAEPWNYRYLLGGLARRLDPVTPIERLREINDAHLASIGADPVELRIQYDITPRAGRPVIPTAFTVTEDVARRSPDGSWSPATPWVFATYAEGGISNLEELLHESGHALHYSAIRTRPAQFSWPPDQTAFVEAVADVVGWSTHEPAFLHHYLGTVVTLRESAIARFAGVALDGAHTLFEIELHRHPDRSPNTVWAEIAERDLGMRGHPEWAWWAVRGQLIDGPGYLANYALGAIMVAAVRARIRATRGDWSTGDLGWYAYVSEALLRYGAERSPRDLLRGLLGGPLTAEALIAEIEGAG